MFVCAVAPGQPYNLSVVSIGATWISLCWEEPDMAGEPGIARYDILVMNTAEGFTFTASTTDNTTNINVTGLSPNSEYEFSVQAVAVRLDATSQGTPSNTAVGLTGRKDGIRSITIFA